MYRRLVLLSEELICYEDAFLHNISAHFKFVTIYWRCLRIYMSSTSMVFTDLMDVYNKSIRCKRKVLHGLEKINCSKLDK